MEEIDLKILHHIGRYTITLRRVLQILFFDGSSAEVAIKRLERLEYVARVERVLPGNFSYYQLTKKGASVIGVSQNRAKPKEPKGLARDLAALWHACMDDKPRRRLLTSELKALCGAPQGENLIFVAQAEPEPSVCRLFIPEADRDLERYTPTLKKAAHDACADEKLIRWIERGTYQFTVLLTNIGRKQKLADLIRADDFPDIRIQIAVAPSPRELPLFISPEKENA